MLLSQNKEEELCAKFRELEQWKSMKVYTEIDDDGQECISLRWVIKPKIIDDKPGIKARLCARGFEEEQNFRTDSPTCSREGLRTMFSLIASKKWPINAIDVKGAFLQGKDLERCIIVRPPKEAQTDKIWKLNKCVYGLGDASRYWYLKVREELCKLGARPSKLDQGVFYFSKNNEIIGVIILFVDDIIWAGKPTFTSVIEKFKIIFRMGKETSEAFTYIGINIKQNDDMSITIDQENYTNSLNLISLTKEQILDPHRKLNEKETTSLRSAIGQLNWLANISRPEISYQVSTISAKIKTATISDIKETNKIIKFVKQNKSFITFPSLHLPSTKVVMYSDASFNNLSDGNSQGGYIIFLSDKYNNSSPIAWKSTKLRRVARSTLAAETLAFTEGADTAYFIAQIGEESTLIQPSSPINTYTDNKSLHDSTNTTNQVADRRLRVEISAIREMKDKGEISLSWISKDNQIADCLMKKGAPYNNLTSALQNGKL